jgi:hypothetical protein
MGVLTRGQGVAPKDGNAYGAKDGAWVRVAEVDGDGEILEQHLPETIEANIIPFKGTEAEVNAVTLAQGMLASTTDTKQLRLGDGTTAGGVAVGGAPIRLFSRSAAVTLPDSATVTIPGISISVTAGQVYKMRFSARVNVPLACGANSLVTFSLILPAPAAGSTYQGRSVAYNKGASTTVNTIQLGASSLIGSCVLGTETEMYIHADREFISATGGNATIAAELAWFDAYDANATVQNITLSIQ